MRVLVIIFLSLLAGCSNTNQLGDAQTAYTRGDNQTAMNLWHKAADHGSLEAQDRLGFMYEQGLDREKRDYTEAMKWYRKAADQGYANAQANVGRMYPYGLGVQKDVVEALFWNLLAEKSIGDNPWAHSERITKYLTREQFASVKRRVENWKPSHRPLTDGVEK